MFIYAARQEYLLSKACLFLWWECLPIKVSLTDRQIAYLYGNFTTSLINPFWICVWVQPTWSGHLKALYIPWEKSLVCIKYKTVWVKFTGQLDWFYSWLHPRYHSNVHCSQKCVVPSGFTTQSSFNKSPKCLHINLRSINCNWVLCVTKSQIFAIFRFQTGQKTVCWLNLLSYFTLGRSNSSGW